MALQIKLHNSICLVSLMTGDNFPIPIAEYTCTFIKQRSHLSCDQCSETGLDQTQPSPAQPVLLTDGELIQAWFSSYLVTITANKTHNLSDQASQ